MGLQDGTIPDANITSSVADSFPERVRLGGDGAWCFTVSWGAAITLTVDLGTTRLVSGVMVQGPPASLYPVTYHYAIGFWILNSTVDATGPWGICCGDNFYARDEYEEAEVTQVHPLKSLVLARYLRLQFRTDVLSIGNDTKCLRLEILGCPANMEPDSGVGLTTERSGWVVMSWRPPVVQLPQVNGSLAPFTLTTTDYQVSISRTGGGEPKMLWEASVKALRYVLPLPLWGATYSATVVCVHQGRQIRCGATSLTAVLDSCDTCIKEDEVMFRRPTVVRACVARDGEVELMWAMDTRGWVTRRLDLLLLSRDGTQIDQRSLTSQDTRGRVTGVTAGNSYTVSFCPMSDSQKLAEFSYNLHIISWENVEGTTQTTGYGAFLADVNLSADVLWNGTLKLTWMPAQVCGMVSGSAAQPTMAAAPQPKQTTQVIQTTQLTQTMDTSPAGVPQAADTTTTRVPQATNTTSITGIPQVTDTSVTTAMTQATQTPQGTNNNASATTETPFLTTDISPSEAILTPPTRQPTTLPQQTQSVVPDIPFLAPGSPALTTGAPTLPPMGGTVMTAITYTLNITYGNEQASETVQQGEGSAPGEPVMRMFMTQISFQTLYTVSIMCSFGSISLECGTTSTFTELPLHIVQVDGQDVVHMVADGRAGWAQQEARCRRGDGNLVSLSTREEEALLVRSLTRDPSQQLSNFWLGLNLCQTYTGRRWSDGSVWRDIWRVYNPNSQLSSTTCCIKAAWNVNQYSWVGEACDALLLAICEYRPNGLMGRVTLLERAAANTTQAGVTWTYEPNFWMPTSFTVSYCLFRKLENITDSGNASDTCLTADLDVEAREHQRDDLEPFTEYQVTVAPSFTLLNYTSGASVTYVRTFPENPLLVKVDSTGFVNIMFAIKVSEFGGEEEVSVRLASTDPYSVVAQRRVPASGVRFGGIQLGVNYTVSVREVNPLRRRETLTLLAYPPCACEGCQVDVSCYMTTKAPANAEQAVRDCQQQGASMVTINLPKEIQQVLQMAMDVGDDLWVQPSSARIRAADCLVVSREARGVVQEDCTIVHLAACSYRAFVAQPFVNINTEVGPTSVSVTWNASASGWLTQQISVIYKKTAERNLRWMAATSQPVVINDLEPDMGYTLVLEADLGSNVLVTSKEFKIFTTNDTTGKLVSPLILGMSPMLQYQALQLVCSSLLVVACIITMLFFFATGMFYQDCVAQLGFESALMVAYLVLMIVYPTSAQTNNKTACIGIAVALHFLFLCAFTFLMLEALTLAHLLVIYIKSPFQRSNWVMVVVGLLLPLLVVAFTAGFGSQQYPDFSVGNCWVNPNGNAMWGEVVPIGILVAATVFLLGNTFFTQQMPPELAEEEHRGRQSDSHKLRWVVLALCVELLVAWASGVAANQSGDQGIYVFFCVMTLVLAITIAGARTSFDDTFRSKMHRLCCGTELTYKRSEILSISARSRITPTHKPEDVSRDNVVPLSTSRSATNASLLSVVHH
ncbi:hypothetical protein O3P69_008418 [Scylla paramamosain]|uniref:Uncharacterized protein n=1 Tax=Scylla paramamosain TaxID=85552 RepID=A0AAW0SLG5_SCYPA